MSQLTITNELRFVGKIQFFSSTKTMNMALRKVFNTCSCLALRWKCGNELLFTMSRSYLQLFSGWGEQSKFTTRWTRWSKNRSRWSLCQRFLKHLFCQLHSSELDTMVAGDVEGDVGEQLVEEAVDHRHDDDARTAALRHQLRHLLLDQHLQGGWTKFVFHHVSS